MTYVLEARGITKRFPGVLANDHIDLHLEEGEILAILGENGAGKSTLMNILYGLYHPDEGEILVKGNSVRLNSPNDAIERGIGMVHQHFMLVPVFTVTENIMLGAETLRNGIVLDKRTVAQQIKELSNRYGLDVDPNALINELPVGVQQRVEIIKALYRKAEILILDEPTAVLTPQEVNDLFNIMRQLTKHGVSIIFITHKLKEILAVADRVTVMRGGKIVGGALPSECDDHKLASLMVGREVILDVQKEPAQPKEEILRIENLCIKDQRGVDVINNVSFSIRAGEILGLAGVQGNGQSELVEALTGLHKSASGHIILTGHDITNSDPRHIIEIGTGHIPEDRQQDGLILSFPVMDNLVLCTYYCPPYAKGTTIRWDIVLENAYQLIKRFDIRTPGPKVHVGNLSGGNQQKVIVARELSRPIKLLVASQPTRGLDVGSIEYIHSQIIKNRDEGVAVLLASTELDEVMQLSDRIAVMYRGKIAAIINAGEATKEQIGLLMAGSNPEQVLEQKVLA